MKPNRAPAVVAVGVFAIALGVSAPARASRSMQAMYITNGTAPGYGVYCSDCKGIEGVNLDGHTFPGFAGEVPTSVAVADLTGSAVSLHVSQDLDGDGLYGEYDAATDTYVEPVKDTCGTTVDLSSSDGPPFQPGLPTQVFIGGWVGVICPATISIAGTITMSWSTA